MSVKIPKPSSKGELKFVYGTELISAQRKTRRSDVYKVLIKVYPDTSVVAVAPESASDEDVLHALHQRARWIYEQRREFKKQLEHVLPRQYVSGESHYYLGKQHQLKIEINPDQNQGVKLLRGKIEVSLRTKPATPAAQQAKVAELMRAWYQVRAKEIFHRRLTELLPKAHWVSTTPQIVVRNMQTQWGSCSPKGRITLNPNLAKTPRECIDYVILHELCHIAEHNHSDRFYKLLKQTMPNWEEVKEHLDGLAGVVLG